MGSQRVNRSTETPSDVPDVLTADLRVVFCGINPGRVSAAANAHFANPRNDFWRLLHAAYFTSRLYDPSEQFELLKEGIGVTNAALPWDERLRWFLALADHVLDVSPTSGS